MFGLPDSLFKGFLIVCCISGYILLVYIRRYNYWKNHGVPYTGFRKDIGLLFKSRSYTLQARYNDLAPHPFGGIYDMSRPVLLVRDPSLIRNILIKDFAHFTDRGVEVNEEIDPLRAHLANLTAQRWKNIRAQLTPTFSSGKLKAMFPLMEECTNILDKHLRQEVGKGKEVDTRGLVLKFAIEVIGTCAFGLNCGTITDEDSEFSKVLKLARPNSLKVFIRKILSTVCPSAVSWFKLKTMSQEVESFFQRLTQESKKHRTSKVEKRNDYMQLLIDVQRKEAEMMSQTQQKDGEVLFTDNVVAAHVYEFFSSGHETPATILGYVLYELALNPEIRERLYEEIKTTLAANGGKLLYDSLKEMNYLDCVISETMRKHPVAPMLTRRCTEPYLIPGSSFTVEENTMVLTPTYALQHDPQYFPNPEKFDPERFNEENKHKIVPGTYLPFGEGPRMCIAMRYALMELKTAVFVIIGNYTVHPSERTQIPIKYKPFTLNAPQHLYLRFQKRENQK